MSTRVTALFRRGTREDSRTYLAMRFGLDSPSPAVRNLLITMGIAPLVFGLFPQLMSWTQMDAAKVGQGEIWRLLTYMPSYELSLLWLFDLLCLWCFGNVLESRLGRTRFYRLFFGCGLAGAAGMAVGNWLNPASPWLAGTWAGARVAIVGLLIAFSLLFPNEEVGILLLLIIVPIRGVYLGPVVAALLVFGSHCSLAAVFASAGMAWLMVSKGWFLESRKSSPRKTRKSRLQFVSASGSKVTPIRSDLEMPRMLTTAEREVDRILDKLRDHGMASLTEEERDTLDAHSSQLRRRDGL